MYSVRPRSASCDHPQRIATNRKAPAHKAAEIAFPIAFMPGRHNTKPGNCPQIGLPVLDPDQENRARDPLMAFHECKFAKKSFAPVAGAAGGHDRRCRTQDSRLPPASAFDPLASDLNRAQ